MRGVGVGVGTLFWVRGNTEVLDVGGGNVTPCGGRALRLTPVGTDGETSVTTREVRVEIGP